MTPGIYVGNVSGNGAPIREPIRQCVPEKPQMGRTGVSWRLRPQTMLKLVRFALRLVHGKKLASMKPRRIAFGPCPGTRARTVPIVPMRRRPTAE